MQVMNPMAKYGRLGKFQVTPDMKKSIAAFATKLNITIL